MPKKLIGGKEGRGTEAHMRKLKEAARLGKIRQSLLGGPPPVTLPKFSWDKKDGTG